ncbi:MAG: phage Gp37/Gp68 family protein [Nitrosopumilus sp.]|nr:phage Gp37/Gp68 family protein [Nitrosopumilus sp.]MDH3486915.1 phage Gp37/Gp68 family protein [Nitrosopumilus sp.]
MEWTEATWNPATGCTKISPGCRNCYAETLTKRLKAMGLQKYKKGFLYVEHPSDVDLPLTWKKPKKIFVNSISDLFHENSIFEFTGRCFATMIQANQYDYQILTKRPKRMVEFSELFFKYFGHKIPNYMWMGTSIESRDYISRINDLRKVKCHTRFISFEPLIASVGKLNLKSIDWVIIGGESGHHYRPVKKQWIEEIIDQCKDQGVAVFFKQWRGFRPKTGGRTINRRKYSEYPQIKRRNALKNIHFDENAFAELCLLHEVQKRKESQSLHAI